MEKLPKEKTKTLTVRIPESIAAKLIEIMKKRTIYRLTDGVIYCIVETADRDLYGYKELLKNRKKRENLSPEEKVKRKEVSEETRKKAKLKVIIDRGHAICETLEGTEITHANGSIGCEYTLYEKIGSRILTGKRIVPLDMLSEEHITMQYKGGTKEEIQEAL